MLELKSTEVVHSSHVKVKYDVVHSTPGRDGTTLRCELTLNINPHSTSAEMVLDDGCDGATPDEAIERMISWLERMAKGLKERRENSIPI